jgi:hypothetical protein
MESILAALKETPIPTILVVAGIVFLLLSIAGQLAGRITVPPERQRQATIIGCLLVVVGVALHVIPPRLNPPEPQRTPAPTVPQPAPKEEQPSQTTAPPPRIEPPPPPPKTQDFQVVPLPLLNARLTALRFFEANPCDIPPLGQRAYKQHFTRKFARQIFGCPGIPVVTHQMWLPRRAKPLETFGRPLNDVLFSREFRESQIFTEVTLEHPKRERRLDFRIHAFYQHEEKVMGEPEWETYIRADQLESVYWIHKDEGVFPLCSGKAQLRRHNWEVGSYTVEVYINQERVTTGSFEIQE